MKHDALTPVLRRVTAWCLAAWAAAASAGATSPALAPLAGMPLYFEANCGQTNPDTGFVARSGSGTFVLSPDEATVTLMTAGTTSRTQLSWRSPSRRIECRSISLQFLGAHPGAAMSGLGLLSGKANYLLGSDPSHWRTNVPLFEKVRVAEAYPGVDVVYYGNDRKLEYDLVLAPGADADAVRLRVIGADKIELDAQGNLVLSVGAGRLLQHKPLLHQVIGGVRTEVAGGYRLEGPQTIGFEVGSYDPRSPLIIDPVLSYASYFGGPNADTAWDVAVDGAGNVYMAGETLSAGLPTTPNAAQTNYGGGYAGAGGDAFVAKFDNTGSNLVYMTYLGGGGDDAAEGIALDAAGDAYLTGVTDSRDFPLKSPIRSAITGIPTPIFGVLPFDAFVTKLDPTGSTLVYSTYVGGDTLDEGIGVAVDSAGSAYITGFTDSTNFYTTNAVQTNLLGVMNAFVAKINPEGSAFAYSTYLGGGNVDQGQGIAVDGLGRAVVTGVTESFNFPATNAIQPLLGGGQDAFVTTFAPDGRSLVRSTYLGGAADDSGYRVAVDSARNPYVVGTEASSWRYDASFPITPGNLNPGGVFTSTDAGATWSPAHAGLLHPQINALAVDPASPNRIYAGTGHGVARSNNGGASWNTAIGVTQLTYGLTPQIAAGYVFSLAVNPLTPSTLYAGTSGGVYRSVDAGADWTLSSTGLVTSYYVPYVWSLAVDPATPARVYAGTSAGVFSSTNAANDWFYANYGLGGLSALALAVDPQSPTNVYAATDFGGVYRSTDRGGLWTAMNNGLANLNCLALALDPQTPSTLYVGTTTGLFKTTDGGTNWSPLTLGAAFTNGLSVNALALDPSTPATLYAGTFAGIFKSSDAGANWTILTNGPSPLSTTALAVNPASSSRVYAGTLTSPILNVNQAFLTKFDANTGAIVYSTALGGDTGSQGWAVALDSNTNAYIVGVTVSANFPTAATSGALSATNHGGNDVFVTAINADASAFLYSAYLGGTLDDFGYGIAVDAVGNAYVVGQTFSTDFPNTNAFQAFQAGYSDAFVAKIQLGTPALVVTTTGNTLQLKWPVFAPEYTLETTPSLSPQAQWTAVPQARILVDGWYTVTLPADGPSAFFRLHGP